MTVLRGVVYKMKKRGPRTIGGARVYKVGGLEFET